MFPLTRLPQREPANRTWIDILDLTGNKLLEARSLDTKVKLFQVLQWLGILAAHRIQEVFHLSRELIIDQVRQVFFQKPHHGKSYPCRDQGIVLLENVVAPDNGLDN